MGCAFFATYATYEMPPLHMTERVLIWQAGVGGLAKLAIEVGQVILVPVLSCVLEMMIGSEG